MSRPDAALGPVLRESGLPGPLAAPERMASVRRLLASVHDTTGLDRLTRLAALLLGTPCAQVSLTGEQQVVVSAFGFELLAPSGPTQDSLCTVTLRSGAALASGDTLRDDRVRALPPVTSGSVRAYLGAPLRNSSGVGLGALCVWDTVPRTWSPEQVGLLGELAESVVAELELRALGVEAGDNAARLDLALEASSIGSFDLEVATQRLRWDDRLVRMFGYDRELFHEHLDSFNDRVHPEDRERVGQAIATAIEQHGELSVEYRIVLPTGETRWVEARGRVLRSPGGSTRLIGVAYDSTDARQARVRLARTLETMNDAFYALDRDWRFTYVNRQAEKLLRRSRDDLLGKGIWDTFPEALGTTFQERYEHAATSGEQVVFEAEFAPLGGWYELSAWPGPDGLSVYFREITARRQVEQERERAYAERQLAVLDRERAYAAAEAANTRLALLADASSRLAASLEPRQVLDRLSEVIVPDLGAWVAVGLTAETGAVLRGGDEPVDLDRVDVVHLAHADPTGRAALADLVDVLPARTSDEAGIGAVVRTGRAEWLPEISDEQLEESVPDPAVLARLRAAGLGSALTVPLVNRGRVLGAVVVGRPAGGPVDRALLADLAGRAAAALDNALSYGAERRTGITLQNSLLPQKVPAVDGLRTAARYLPGAAGAFVGGDWYQGVRVGAGLVLAMGDVMGHGMRSAARMGQLRAIVATLALEGHGPAVLLRRLADNVDVLLDLELATLLVAAYDPGAGTLTVSSAGHPPPLRAPARGRPAFVDLDPGPPIGAFPYDYTETVVPLLPGDTVVLYTDGLVEDRAEPLDVGLERLRSALEQGSAPEQGSATPGEVCDRVLDRTGRVRGGDDDVALLVLMRDSGPCPEVAS